VEDGYDRNGKAEGVGGEGSKESYVTQEEGERVGVSGVYC
jgi:hypothetical protein